MSRFTKPVAVALVCAGLLAGCATYDAGYARPYAYSYGYDYGPYHDPYYDYAPYYRYGPGYYVGPPAIGFNFHYHDRDGRSRHDRDHARHSSAHRHASSVERTQAALSPPRPSRIAGPARPGATRTADAAARMQRGVGAREGRREERG